ncbi:unnamed protein product [Adineta ricciae]|nr:unnamed protein product [Adineta ricciae]
MGRLFGNLAIFLFVLMFVNSNEGRSLMFDALQPTNTKAPVQHSDFDVVDSWSPEEQILDNDRQKRNCFLYAMKSKNRASKWMCW